MQYIKKNESVQTASADLNTNHQEAKEVYHRQRIYMYLLRLYSHDASWVAMAMTIY